MHVIETGYVQKVIESFLKNSDTTIIDKFNSMRTSDLRLTDDGYDEVLKWLSRNDLISSLVELELNGSLDEKLSNLSHYDAVQQISTGKDRLLNLAVDDYSDKAPAKLGNMRVSVDDLVSTDMIGLVGELSSYAPYQRGHERSYHRSTVEISLPNDCPKAIKLLRHTLKVNMINPDAMAGFSKATWILAINFAYNVNGVPYPKSANFIIEDVVAGKERIVPNKERVPLNTMVSFLSFLLTTIYEESIIDDFITDKVIPLKTNNPFDMWEVEVLTPKTISVKNIGDYRVLEWERLVRETAAA